MEEEDGAREQERENREKEVGDIQEKEIWDVMRKMKKRKAVEIDGIPIKTWKYVEKNLRNNLVKLLKQIWYNTRRLEEEYSDTYIRGSFIN